jgi:hypothetical protein
MVYEAFQAGSASNTAQRDSTEGEKTSHNDYELAHGSLLLF